LTYLKSYIGISGSGSLGVLGIYRIREPGRIGVSEGVARGVYSEFKKHFSRGLGDSP